MTKLKYFLASDIAETDIKIVLPEHAKNIESFSIILDILLKGVYKFVYISKNQVAHVQELYTITSPSNVVFNSAYREEFGKNFFFLDQERIDYVRDSVLKSSQYKSFLSGADDNINLKKIYFARKKHAARNYNQDEVLNVVVKQGFEPVYLEDFSFFQQVYLFQNADYVMGASGAAWTNLIYLKKGTQGLSWLSENISSFSCYSTLAKYYECDLKFFTCEVDNKKDAHSDYHVDLSVLENKML